MFNYAFGEAATGSGAEEKLQPGFEGPEKSLHVVFEGEGSLRSVPQARWSLLLDLARCKILSATHGLACDAYVLSESSLFVYDRHIVLKTCGTTRLLDALDDALAVGASRGLQPRTIFYARKNFTFPELQPAPYRSFADECAFLDERLGSARSTYSAIAGPLSADHWCFYVASFADDADADADVAELSLFEVKMHEIDPARAALFVERDGWTGKLATAASGIAALLPPVVQQTIDEHLFSPCGYSMNGLVGAAWYSTIHVTPEPHCSYVSFETNVPVAAAAIPELLARVVDVFRPATFSVTLIGAHCSAVAQLLDAAAVSSSCGDAGAVVLCGMPASINLGMLPITMLSYTVSDIAAHPLGVQALRRLAHLAQRAKSDSADVLPAAVLPSPSASPTASEGAASSSVANSDGIDDADPLLLQQLASLGATAASYIPMADSFEA